MFKRLMCVVLTLCLALCCWGCTQTPGPDSTTGTVPGETTEAGGPVTAPTVPEGAPKPETTEMNTAPETFPYPTENVDAASLRGHGAIASGSNGYYSGRQTLKYTDMDSWKTISLCPQPGCTHQDETCHAWMGENVSQLCDYHGSLYAITEDGNGGFQFLSKDPATGERKILGQWEAEDEWEYYEQVILGNFSDGRCTIITILQHINPEEEDWTETHKYIYDFTAGTWEELPQEYTDIQWSVAGIYGDYLLLTHRDELITEEVYAKWGAEFYGDISYQEYLKNRIPSEVRLYNLKTGETQIIASEEEGLILSGDPALTYGYTYIYQKGNDICLYDLQTQEERVAVTMERVINFWILDHKIFLIQTFTENPDSGCYIYFMDMDGGPLYLLPNGGSTDGMEYGIIVEGDGFFIGTYRSGMSIISKADFYADRYDRSRTGGY